MALLFVAAVMTGLTTCLLANDLHWAQSSAMQLFMILLICFVAAGICFGMMIRFALAYYAERRARREGNPGSSDEAAEGTQGPPTG
mmetsp:Transcript_23472/g.41537  ORF Transcript_23472/g.41537 Transcript_23472/m.41537 type:complete len:86 (+) Transcript_23472:213-470(+)